jgi:hypothetical protein
MTYKHKELDFLINKKDFESLTETQQSDFIDLKFEKSKQLIYQRYFRHFAMRLSERYGICIKFEEYVLFCNLQFLRRQKRIIKEGKAPYLRGEIKIQGVEVIVYRSMTKYKQLLTVIKK